MKYLNLSASLNCEEDMLRATHEEKGIWFDLICYCHQQMNNGMIQGCQTWTDAMWQRIAGVDGAAIAKESPLWHFSSMMCLVVHHYDANAEVTYRRKQRLGKEFAEKRWSQVRQKKIVNIRVKNGSPIGLPNGSPNA